MSRPFYETDNTAVVRFVKRYALNKLQEVLYEARS